MTLVSVLEGWESAYMTPKMELPATGVVKKRWMITLFVHLKIVEGEEPCLCHSAECAYGIATGKMYSKHLLVASGSVQNVEEDVEKLVRVVAIAVLAERREVFHQPIKL
jgi:hypothetical protein